MAGTERGHDPSDDSTEADLVRFGSYVDAEIQFESTLRSSLDTKAFALASMNLGIVTLYFALRTQLSLWQDPVDGAIRNLLVVSTIGALASVFAAATSALPSKYRRPRASGLEDLLAAFVRTGASPLTHRELISARIEQYEKAARVNHIRAWILAASFGLFGAAAASFMLAIAVTVLTLR